MPYVLTAACIFAVACLLPPSASTWVLSLSAADVAAGLAAARAHLAGRWYAYAILGFATYYLLSARPSVYLVDFAVFEPPEEWQVRCADGGTAGAPLHAPPEAVGRWGGGRGWG